MWCPSKDAADQEKEKEVPLETHTRHDKSIDISTNGTLASEQLAPKRHVRMPKIMEEMPKNRVKRRKLAPAPNNQLKFIFYSFIFIIFYIFFYHLFNYLYSNSIFYHYIIISITYIYIYLAQFYFYHLRIFQPLRRT